MSYCEPEDDYRIEASVALLTIMAKTKKKPDGPLEGEALIKETCRRIRAAKGLWDAHRNAACRGERDRALVLYNQLTKEQKEKIPQQLRIWLRYRSEKYFGPHQTPPAKKSGKQKPSSRKSSKKRGQKTARKKHTHSQNADQKPLW